MDKDTFYRVLVQVMVRLGFKLQASDVSQTDLTAKGDKMNSILRAIAKFSKPVWDAINPVGGAMAPEFAMETVFDQESIQKHLNKVNEWAVIGCVKYFFAQPAIVAVVEADKLTNEEIINLAKRLDEVVLDMRDVTAKMRIDQVGIRIGSVKLSVTGIILLIFFDHKLASAFIESGQKKCKIQHFFQKSWVLPWVVDVSKQIVTSHPGLPFSVGVLSRVDLQKEIFQ
jgi:hypothetical protein